MIKDTIQYLRFLKHSLEQLTLIMNACIGKVQFEMTGICLHYFTLEYFKSGHCTSGKEWQDRISRMPFFEYTACNWGRHAKECETDFLENRAMTSLIRILEKKHIIACLGQAIIGRALQSSRENLSGDEASYFPKGWTELKRNDPPTMPALHILTYFDLQGIAGEWLRRKKMDVNVLSPRRYTPLWLACHRGYTNLVELLLEYGADPGLENGHGRLCLAAAVFYSHSSIVELLLSHDLDNKIGEQLLSQVNWYGRSIFIDAMTSGRTDILQALLDRVAEMGDRSDLLLKQDEHGIGMLHEAAQYGHHDLINIIFRETSREDTQTLLCQQELDWGEFPLHRAVLAAQAESIRALIRAGANLAVRQFHGLTPLHYAARCLAATHSDIVHLLLSHGADPNLRDDKQNTALHEAAAFGRPNQIKALLSDPRTKLSLEAKDEGGLTPLGRAWKQRFNDYDGVVHILQEAGAQPPQSTSTSRNELQIINQTFGDAIYMTSAPIPSSWRTPILRITFTIESHDQGGPSDDWPWDDGTYHNSKTWFEIGLEREDSVVRKVELTGNVRSRTDWRVHEISWDIDHGDLGGGSRGHGLYAQHCVTKFMSELAHGDRVVLIMKAVYVGWLNYVKRAEMKIFYVE